MNHSNLLYGSLQPKSDAEVKYKVKWDNGHGGEDWIQGGWGRVGTDSYCRHFLFILDFF